MSARCVAPCSPPPAATRWRKTNKDRFLLLGIDPVGNTPEEFTQFLKDEIAKWATVIKQANVRIEN